MPAVLRTYGCRIIGGLWRASLSTEWPCTIVISSYQSISIIKPHIFLFCILFLHLAAVWWYHVHIDDGRVIRPLLCIPKDPLEAASRLWTSKEVSGDVEDLLESGRIRYVDAMEASTADIALFPRDAREKNKTGTFHLPFHQFLFIYTTHHPATLSTQNVPQ